MQTQSPDSSVGITLVLGTGFLKCAAALGLVQVLQQEDIPIKSIVGSSTGALIGAGIAMGHSPEQTLNFLKKLGPLQSFATPRRFNFNERSGRLAAKSYQELIAETFGSSSFADSKIPLQITAANFTNGNRVLLNNGPLAPALLASAGLPGLMAPVSHQGQTLVDGAFVDPLPISAAIEAGAEIIVAMGFELPYLSEIHSTAQSVYQQSSIAINHLLVSEIAFGSLAHHNEIILINPRFGLSIQFTDIHHLPFIVEQGAEATKAMIPYLKNLLAQS
jgi:NTE family protein